MSPRFVSYIDRSREYYAAQGYPMPYRWAENDDAPFAQVAVECLRDVLLEGMCHVATSCGWLGLCAVGLCLWLELARRAGLREPLLRSTMCARR